MEYSILTKTGDREINEDSVGAVVTEQGFCCLVADGLGGHDRGEVASALVKKTGIELFETMGREDTLSLKDFLDRCFTEGQSRLLEKQKSADSEMKTTLVVLAGVKGSLQWGHIGDSRLYYFKNGRMMLHTLDHSVPQMLVRTGEIKEKDIRGHEDRNRLLRVMGNVWQLQKYELAEPIREEEGQAFLLCSDGFWELIEEKQMVHFLNQAESPKHWLELMEEEILKNGQGKNMDNYSAAAVFFGKAGKRKKFFGIF